jgi:hypothetical protein
VIGERVRGRKAYRIGRDELAPLDEMSCCSVLVLQCPSDADVEADGLVNGDVGVRGGVRSIDGIIMALGRCSAEYPVERSRNCCLSTINR